MRFRAEITNVVTFSKLISSLTPMSKIATLKLKSDVVHVICITEVRGIQVWSQIAVASIFNVETFRLESNANNEVYLEVSTEALGRALKSALNATSVMLKLTKKGGHGVNGAGGDSVPVLSLSCSTVSRSGKPIEITQDVKVNVKKAQDMALLKEPMCPTPDVNIILPPLITLRTVAERLKTISPIITILANNRGEFRLQARSDEANVQTEWRDLRRPPAPADEEGTQTQPTPDPSQFFSVNVDAKSLVKFLASYSIATSTIACICEDHCAIFYVYIGDGDRLERGGVLTWFLSGVSVDDD